MCFLAENYETCTETEKCDPSTWKQIGTVTAFEGMLMWGLADKYVKTTIMNVSTEPKGTAPKGLQNKRNYKKITKWEFWSQKVQLPKWCYYRNIIGSNCQQRTVDLKINY